MKIAAVVGLMALGFAAASAAPNQYLCITENVGGLHYDARTQSWKPQGFTPNGKYILRRLNADDVQQYGVLLQYPEFRNDKLQYEQRFGVGSWAFFTFGERPQLLALCVESYLGLSWGCEPFRVAPVSDFGTDAHRFEMVYRGGYIEQGRQEQLRLDPKTLKREPPGFVSDPSHPDDLVIEVGKCSPF